MRTPHSDLLLVQALMGADASCISACALRLQSTARDRYLPLIAEQFPELASRYRRAYVRDYQVGERYRAGLRRRFAAVCATHGVAFGRVNRPEDEDDDEEMALAAATALTAQLDVPL